MIINNFHLNKKIDAKKNSQLLINFTLTHVQYAFLKPSLALDTMSNEHAKATQ